MVTAIDVAILKEDLKNTSGHARWVEGGNMVTDPLTQNMKGDFVRKVCNSGYWSLTHVGHEKQYQDTFKY